ncbi:hypothetical protein U1Q18_024261 [Sarracenia purpurea var. burkii]
MQKKKQKTAAAPILSQGRATALEKLRKSKTAAKRQPTTRRKKQQAKTQQYPVEKTHSCMQKMQKQAAATPTAAAITNKGQLHMNSYCSKLPLTKADE